MLLQKGVRMPEYRQGDSTANLTTKLRSSIYACKLDDAVSTGIQALSGRAETQPACAIVGVVSRSMTRGCRSLTEIMRPAFWSFEAAWDIVRVLHDVDAVQLLEAFVVELVRSISRLLLMRKFVQEPGPPAVLRFLPGRDHGQAARVSRRFREDVQQCQVRRGTRCRTELAPLKVALPSGRCWPNINGYWPSSPSIQ